MSGSAERIDDTPGKKDRLKATKACAETGLEPGAILNALAEPIFVVDDDGRVCYANLAAEQFLATSATALLGRQLKEILPPDSPVFSLINLVRLAGQSVSEYGVTIETPKNRFAFRLG